MRISKNLPNWVNECARRVVGKLDPYVGLSYSQEGEDMILRRLIKKQRHGFYVDVGAHHPFRFSNTCFFYRRGWHGINIDADPAAIAAFRRYRPRDINVCVGVSDAESPMTFYRFNESALNTFDKNLANERTRTPAYRLLESVNIPVRRLDDILSSHIDQSQAIDILSIDVEGHDAQVLRSNDWSRFRPRFLLIEALNTSLENLTEDESYSIATNAGYRLVAKTVNTLIFRREEIEAAG
jgi:FkbM family methyltransferase